MTAVAEVEDVAAEAEAPPAAPRLAVTEPGVYDLDEAAYHADPVPRELGGSLSCSSAKWLLPPFVPAKYAYYRDHPKPPTAAMELGTAAHKLVLGTGAELVRVDYEDWRTGKARQEAAEARERGAVPLLAHEYAIVLEMAAALRADPDAAMLLDAARGEPEQSMFWTDPAAGAWLRSRLDLFPHHAADLTIAADYKTAKSADPESFAKAAYDYGYFRQAPWYCAAVRARYPGADVAFAFVVQEKDAPYLVNVLQLDGPAMRAGEADNRRAIETFAECTASGHWPGYDQFSLVSLPAWAARRYNGGMF